MKKFLIFSLIVALSMNILYADAYQDSNIMDERNNYVELVERKEITDPETIAKIAEKENFEDPEDIVSIVYCYFDKGVNSGFSASNASSVTPRLGNDYYIKNIEKSTARGKLLRSSKYVSPGGSMTISESLSVAISVGVGIDYKILSSSLDFDVEATYTVSDTQNITVPSGKTYTLNAYVNNLVYTFDIWENDLFFDEEVCKGSTVKKPIGVVFTIKKS